MSALTTFYDNKSTGMREAWQNGKCVYQWNYKEIEHMSKEKGSTVPAFGHYQAPRNTK